MEQASVVTYFFMSTIGNVSTDIVQQYIESQMKKSLNN